MKPNVLKRIAVMTPVVIILLALIGQGKVRDVPRTIREQDTIVCKTFEKLDHIEQLVEMQVK